MTETDTASPKRPVSRRALAAGVAWSAPAVWLTAAAPAMAASPGIEIGFTQAMWSGNDGFWIPKFTITGPNGTVITGISVEALNLNSTVSAITTRPLGSLVWDSTFKNVTIANGVAEYEEKMRWANYNDKQASLGRFGATDCDEKVGTTNPNYAKSDVAYSNYSKSATTCTVGTNANGDEDCTCASARCIGPCALLAMSGPFKVTVTTSALTNNTKTIIVNYPGSCGWKAKCEGLTFSF